MRVCSLVLLLAIVAQAFPVQTTTPQNELFRRADSSTPSMANAETVTVPTTTATGLSSTLSKVPSTNTCVPTIAPDKNGWVPPSECNALYLYYPSFKAAVAAAVIFGIIMVAHLIQGVIYRAVFVWVIVMGVSWETISYAVRVLSTRRQQDEGVATATQMFVLLAPLWVNAFDYMVFAQMVHFFLPERRIGIFKPSLLAKLFVILDIGAFFVQGAGGLMANEDELEMKGIHIYMGGIGIQQFFILCFLVLVVLFHRSMLHLDKMGQLVEEKQKWRGLLYALYASLIAITVRIIYRLVEFSGGFSESNPIPYHEWYLYVFDGIPMALAILAWNFAPPGAVLQGPDAKIPSSGIGKFFCCNGCACCCRSRRKRKGEKDMQRLSDHGQYGSDVPLQNRSLSPGQDI